MKSTIQMGHLGERIALNYLLDKKYVLMGRNWRHFKKEIDIILRNEQHIVFVEVKLRSTFFSSLNHILSCLLYTSPSPRDKRQSRMPSSA